MEVPARIDRTGATPIATAPLAPEMLGLVQHVKAYEALAIEAALSGSDAVALRALVANPLVHGDVPGLLDAIIEANLRFLPRFGPTPA